MSVIEERKHLRSSSNTFFCSLNISFKMNKTIICHSLNGSISFSTKTQSWYENKQLCILYICLYLFCICYCIFMSSLYRCIWLMRIKMIDWTKWILICHFSFYNVINNWLDHVLPSKLLHTNNCTIINHNS